MVATNHREPVFETPKLFTAYGVDVTDGSEKPPHHLTTECQENQELQ